MAKMALPYTIINGDPVDAGPVQSNYTTIQQHSNQEMIERGGTVAMVGQLKLAGNPVAELDAAPKQYVDQLLPVGIITMFGGATAPVGGVWLLCDGTQYEATAYPALAAVIGGVVSGLFRVPNLVNRFPYGGGGSVGHGATGGTADAVVVAHTHAIDHAHGNTGTTNTDHLHAVEWHNHRVDLFTNFAGDHTHSGQDGPLVQALGAGIHVSEGGAGPAFYAGWSATSTSGSHQHATNGDTGGATPNTGWQDRTGTHAHTTPAFNGASGGASSGESGTGKNLPPYVAISFVIRAA
jgi:hypothetical protein